MKKVNISSYSKKLDFMFYEHYFNDTAVAAGLKLVDFFDPLNYKGQTKTINSEYMKLIFKSQKFKEDFLEYLDSGELARDYHGILRRKVRQILIRFDGLFESSAPSTMEQGVKVIQHYFRNNKQCKLPWRHTEVDSAIRMFKMMINKSD